MWAAQDGNVGLVKACRGYLLCAYADTDVDIGMLKRKVCCRVCCNGCWVALMVGATPMPVSTQLEAARDYLKDPLSQIDDTDDSGDESKQETA